MVLMDQHPGLRERKKVQTRRHVREVALTLFVEHGYDTVSVEQIAEAADVSRTTFFNYFPGKEAVITGQDPESLAQLRALCEERPPTESLWDSLTSVMLDNLDSSRVIITARKTLQETSPALSHLMHTGSKPVIAEILAWAESRVPTSQRTEARLQLNVITAAISTAFDQWDLREPYARFVELSRAHASHLARAFNA